MKKFFLALAALVTVAVTARAMSYEQACQQALFLTDKMAYELNLTDDQYEAAYEVNLDYLMSISSYDDLYGVYWQQRNLDLSYILLDWQYRAYVDAAYFYRPLYWSGGYWHFSIYARYPHRDYFFFGRPHFFHVYRGGHSWHHNGGRSWYHGREFGPRPGHERMGMRDGFDRGNYGRGTRGLDRGGARPGQGAGSGVRPGNQSQPRGGNQGISGGQRPRSSFGNGTSGNMNRSNGGATARPMDNGTTARPQGGIATEARPRTNLDRNGATSSMRESSTRQTATRQSTDMSRAAQSRSAERATSSMQSSSQRSTTSSSLMRSGAASQRSMSASPSRSMSSPQRSSSSSMSRSSAPSSSSRSSMGGAGRSSGGGSRGGGSFGGHR